MIVGNRLPIAGMWYKVTAVEESGRKVTLEQQEQTTKSIKRSNNEIKRLTKLGVRVKL